MLIDVEKRQLPANRDRSFPIVPSFRGLVRLSRPYTATFRSKAWARILLSRRNTHFDTSIIIAELGGKVAAVTRLRTTEFVSPVTEAATEVCWKEKSKSVNLTRSRWRFKVLACGAETRR